MVVFVVFLNSDLCITGLQKCLSIYFKYTKCTRVLFKSVFINNFCCIFFLYNTSIVKATFVIEVLPYHHVTDARNIIILYVYINTRFLLVRYISNRLLFLNFYLILMKIDFQINLLQFSCSYLVMSLHLKKNERNKRIFII